jgi:hypothetical protein
MCIGLGPLGTDPGEKRAVPITTPSPPLSSKLFFGFLLVSFWFPVGFLLVFSRRPCSGSDSWCDLHARLQFWADKHPAVPSDGVFNYLQCEITQAPSSVLLGRTIRQDAELANAVLLDLLRGPWMGKSLQIVTHDFCNDEVIDALVSRNMIVDPELCPVASRGNCVAFPQQLRLCDRMTSSNGRCNTAPRVPPHVFVTILPDTVSQSHAQPSPTRA